jgi:uncharacterized membrane protein
VPQFAGYSGEAEPKEERMEEAAQSKKTTEGTAKVVYILYLVGIVVGVTAIIGLILAYLNRNDAADWLKSHYQFQIRTFWIGLLYTAIGGILTLIVVGYLVFLFWLVWLIVRCVKGMKYLNDNKAHPNPTGWVF